MWIAEMETEHFSWRAFGTTQTQAREALEAGWLAHLTQYGVGAEDDVLSPEAALDYYEPAIYRVRPGVCLRDGSQIGDKV